VDLDIFWRHSFGGDMVCREFADRIGCVGPENAYLAGLLHDIGIIVNSLVYTEEFRITVAAAASAGRPLVEQAQETLGFTHCGSGAF
jgi:HD-like signal output (HDOD) protein